MCSAQESRLFLDVDFCRYYHHHHDVNGNSLSLFITSTVEHTTVIEMIMRILFRNSLSERSVTRKFTFLSIDNLLLNQWERFFCINIIN